MAWLGLVNDLRRENKLTPLSVECFERAIDRFEKESFAASLDHRHAGKADSSTSSSRASNGLSSPCAVCSETEDDSMNLLLVCNACSLTVHQVASHYFTFTYMNPSIIVIIIIIIIIIIIQFIRCRNMS